MCGGGGGGQVRELRAKIKARQRRQDKAPAPAPPPPPPPVGGSGYALASGGSDPGGAPMLREVSALTHLYCMEQAIENEWRVTLGGWVGGAAGWVSREKNALADRLWRRSGGGWTGSRQPSPAESTAQPRRKRRRSTAPSSRCRCASGVLCRAAVSLRRALRRWLRRLVALRLCCASRGPCEDPFARRAFQTLC